MKNLLNVFITISSLITIIHSQELPQITSVQYSSEKTGYVLSESNKYRLYTPERAKIIQSLGKNASTRGDYRNYMNLRHRGQYDPIDIKEAAVELSGPYIILLEPYQIPLYVNRIGSNVLFNQSDTASPFIKIDNRNDYQEISEKAKSSNGAEYKGCKLFTDGQCLPYRYSSMRGINESNYKRTYSATYQSGRKLLQMWEQFLNGVRFSYYGKPFFLRLKNGDVYPAVIKVFGTQRKMYAMYGVWTDEERAKRYGYKKGDRVYFSEKELLPAGDNDCIAATEFQINSEMRYGKQTYRYEEIVNNPEEIYRKLAWSSELIHSAVDGKEYDRVGRAYKNGFEVPIAPDNDNNENGMGLQHCPDKDWYFDLFCECAGEIISDDDKERTAEGFVDYKDYAHMKMMGETYDPTIYGEDGSVTTLKADTDVQPADPLLFNKDGVLLSGRIPEVFDPFASDAKFFLYKRYWDWSIGNTGFHKKNKWISSKMKQCLKELKYVYDYFTTDGSHQTDWSYKKVGKKWTKQWRYRGDVEINIDKPEYADSAWTIANPFANYEPFEDFETFAVYDNNTAANIGPFRTISRESDTHTERKRGEPEYRRYNNPWIGDIPAESAWDKKDWFIQWQYYLVYQDKWGRKTCVGTLTFTSSLWMNEDENVMPHNYKFNGSHYNKTIMISGSQRLTKQSAYYDKNSKQYRTDQTDLHEREPDEFDKSEAMREIARKILVAEAFDYSMKTIHYIGTRQKNQVGVAAGVLYEASKRVENRIAQSQAYKLAKHTYEGLLFWRRTMDVVRDLRDTYIRIGDAWDGLLYTVSAVKDYYADIDLRDIRLTNITDLFPRSAFIELDYRVFSMQKSFADFNEAVHAMAIETDSITGGNYGPLNPAIRTAYAALQSSALQTGQNTTRLLDNTNGEVQKLKNVSNSTSSDQQYLSNITRSTSNIISNQRLKVMNNGTRNVALALYLTQSDAKQWLTYSRYMKQLSKDVPERFEEAAKNVDSDSWAALAWSIHQPRVFDNLTSDFMMQIAEEENNEK